MTDEESAEFDKELEKAREYAEMAQSGKHPHQGEVEHDGKKHIKVIRKHGEHDGKQIKVVKKLGSPQDGKHGKQIKIVKHIDANGEDVDIEELVRMAEAMAAKEMQHMEVEIERAHGATDHAQREIEKALDELAAAEASNEISKKEC